MQCSAEHSSVVQCSAVMCSVVQCSAVQCSGAVQCIIVQCSFQGSVGSAIVREALRLRLEGLGWQVGWVETTKKKQGEMESCKLNIN